MNLGEGRDSWPTESSSIPMESIDQSLSPTWHPDNDPPPSVEESELATAGRHPTRSEPPPSSSVPDHASRPGESGAPRLRIGGGSVGVRRRLLLRRSGRRGGTEEDESDRMLDSDGWVPGRGVQWVLIGDRGAKKHLYADRLSKLLEVPHISTGSLFRQELNPRSSLYGIPLANAVNERKLVPDEVIFALLSKRLEEGCYRGENGFILDGIPRARAQAEIVDRIADTDLVVNLKRTNEHLTKSPKDYYRKQHKLIDFQVKSAPGETWQGLLAALHLQHINAVNSSQKLTA
ncbi:hypothetical protein ACFX1T_044701 [Malus domestica]